MSLLRQSISAQDAGVVHAGPALAGDLDNVTWLRADWPRAAQHCYAQSQLSPAQKLMWTVGLATASWVALIVPIALIA